MAYIGLVLTSLGFLIPGWVAWCSRRRGNRKNLDICTSLAIATSSVLYHGTLHPVAQRIDMCLAHMLGCLSIGRSVFHLVAWRRGIIELGIVGGTFGSIGIYLFKSRLNPHPNARYWHMVFHLVGQTTWVAHVALLKTNPSFNSKVE